MADKKWSECSTHELLDMAQGMYDRDAPQAVAALLAAAQVQATLESAWTLENRLAPGISNAIWEGLRNHG